MERTLSIIKPDAVDAGNTGKIIDMIEKTGLRIIALKKVYLTKGKAEGFYDVHRKRPFFKSLIKYMTSGPVVISVLEGENAIEKYRKLMGPTDSTKASNRSIRGKYGTNIEANAVHGSDSPETADFEISYFFNVFEFIKPQKKA